MSRMLSEVEDRNSDRVKRIKELLKHHQATDAGKPKVDALVNGSFNSLAKLVSTMHKLEGAVHLVSLNDFA